MVDKEGQAENRRLFAAIGEALLARGLDPTPENYAALHKAVTSGVPSKVCPLAEPEPQQGHDAAQELLQVARRQAEALANVAASTREEVRDYQGDLQFGAEQLAAGAGPASIAALLRITDTMVERSRLAEARLEQATEEARALRQKLLDAQSEARTDALTGISNRRAFEDRFAALSEAGVGLTVGLCDIDRFKSINDTHGHAVGDRVLKLVAQVLTKNCAGAMVARYGGEEFVVLFAATNATIASRLIEASRDAVAASPFKDRETGTPIGQITFSAGVASLRPGEGEHALMRRADRLLYKAKASGRNRIEVDNGFRPPVRATPAITRSAPVQP
jgi:diguanylate cyclase